jgi:filamentous hemagglutinin
VAKTINAARGKIGNVGGGKANQTVSNGADSSKPAALPAPPEKPLLPAPAPTIDIIDGVTVVDINTGKVFTGSVDLRGTLDRIARGEKYPHKNDGTPYMNDDGGLPRQPEKYYTEYVVPTQGIKGAGPQRIVIGLGGEKYYTPDHYSTFIRLNP